MTNQVIILVTFLLYLKIERAKAAFLFKVTHLSKTFWDVGGINSVAIFNILGILQKIIKNNVFVRFKADTHFAPQNTLLLGNTLHQSGWYTLRPNSLSFSKHSLTYFTPQQTLLLSTLSELEHFPNWKTFRTRTLSELEHFLKWNTLLHGTLYFLEHVALSAKYLKEEKSPLSNVFQGGSYFRKQSVLRRNAF